MANGIFGTITARKYSLAQARQAREDILNRRFPQVEICGAIAITLK